MERTVQAIVDNAICQKQDQQHRDALREEFGGRIRDDLKKGKFDSSTLEWKSGKLLVDFLIAEDLNDFVETLVNKIINRVDIIGNKDLNHRKQLLIQFRDVINKLSKNSIISLKVSDEDTLLQNLCNFDLEEFVEVLIDRATALNVSKDLVNATGKSNIPPILKVASKGNKNTLKLLLSNNADVGKVRFKPKEFNESIIHVLLREGDGSHLDKDNFQQCLTLLLWPLEDQNRIKTEINQIIDHNDKFGKTALYYATKSWPNNIVLGLLKNGAAIGDLTKRISPDVLKEYLDNHCIKSNYNEDTDPNTLFTEESDEDDMRVHLNHSQLKITFDYSFLLSVPDEEKETRDEESCPLLCNFGKKSALDETKPLRALAQSKEHSHLLNHPVITSFLWLKWIRIRRYYNINVRFYSMFVFVLTWFILYGLGTNKTLSYNPAFQFFFGATSTILILSTIYDTIAIFVAKKLQNDYQRPQSISEDNSTCCGNCFRFLRAHFLELLANILIAVMVLCSMGLFFQGIPMKTELEDNEENNEFFFEQRENLWWIVLFFTVGLLLRETFQIWVYRLCYIYSLQNWFVILSIVLASLLLVPNLEPEPHHNEAKRHLAGIVIVLSWTNLIMLIGQGHNRLSKYVTMLFKVTKSFFIFLCLYIFFIIAFAIGFYVSLNTSVIPAPITTEKPLQDVSGVTPLKDGCQNGTIELILKKIEGLQDENFNFFKDGWHSMVKTTTMFSGELEFGDIPFENGSVYVSLAYLFFLSFVFFIVIVMMNLLTGLAVDDISTIRAKAEIVSHKTKVEIIWKVEKQLLQCWHDSSIGSFLQGHKFSFCPNNPTDPIHPIHPPDIFPRCKSLFKEKEFIEPAKRIIVQRVRNELSVDDKISVLEEKLTKSQNEMEKMNLKMEEILNVLKNTKNITS